MGRSPAVSPQSPDSNRAQQRKWSVLQARFRTTRDGFECGIHVESPARPRVDHPKDFLNMIGHLVEAFFAPQQRSFGIVKKTGSLNVLRTSARQFMNEEKATATRAGRIRPSNKDERSKLRIRVPGEREPE
jgi:hypothetical protein